MAGLVIQDLHGRDYVISLVSDEMWDQITKVPNMIGNGSEYGFRFSSVVGWIVHSEPNEAVRPDVEGCPKEREGFVVKEWYCSAPVIETTNIADNIAGVVFLTAF